mmetsp:Transcript_847/g.892  ORF Transcript_847/g.892 Transcript_847/m.892 type:complete len:87 (+) Transcript_847:797-1057(+)
MSNFTLGCRDLGSHKFMNLSNTHHKTQNEKDLNNGDGRNLFLQESLTSQKNSGVPNEEEALESEGDTFSRGNSINNDLAKGATMGS